MLGATQDAVDIAMLSSLGPKVLPRMSEG